ncbi:hypothetical protein RJ45_08680, partial [Photobacterium gaetbulicola]
MNRHAVPAVVVPNRLGLQRGQQAVAREGVPPWPKTSEANPVAAQQVGQRVPKATWQGVKISRNYGQLASPRLVACGGLN